MQDIKKSKISLGLKELTYERWCGTRWLCLKETKDLDTPAVLNLLKLMKDHTLCIKIPRGCVWGTRVEIRRWIRRQCYWMVKRHSVVDLIHLHHVLDTSSDYAVPMLGSESVDEWDEVIAEWAKYVASKIQCIDGMVTDGAQL